MDIKKFGVEHEPTGGAIVVTIDFDHAHKFGGRELTMDENIKQMAEFWLTSEERLIQNDGNHLETYLKNLCAEVMLIATAGNYNISGVISRFENKEGWCALDGSSGIKLIGLDRMNLKYQGEYEITKMK